MKLSLLRFALLLAAAVPAFAGPPFVNDDPVPTETHHFETYLFASGAIARDGQSGAMGVDFNYGGGTDLQLTAVLPLEWDSPSSEPRSRGIGNVELAAKYRFLHQADHGVDVAFFPRLFLPAPSIGIGEQHASLLLPLWIGWDHEGWGTFGGGGCTLHRSSTAKDFCQAGWVVARKLAPTVQLGAEIYHRNADIRGGDAKTGVGLGLTVDLSDHLHVLASAGPGLGHAATTDHAIWYAALQLTY